VAWENGEMNIADVLTKLMPGPWLKDLIGYVLWYITPWVWTDMASAMEANAPFSFFLFLWWTPHNTDGRVVVSVGSLCFGLVCHGYVWHRVTPGMSGNMSRISCLFLQSARITRQ
jgi:hypothetical protein